MAESDPPIQIALSGLAPAEWFTKPSESSFWLRIYTCLFIPHDDFTNALNSMFGSPAGGSMAMRLAGRLILAFGRTNDIQVTQSTFEITSADSVKLFALNKEQINPAVRKFPITNSVNVVSRQVFFYHFVNSQRNFRIFNSL